MFSESWIVTNQKQLIFKFVDRLLQYVNYINANVECLVLSYATKTAAEGGCMGGLLMLENYDLKLWNSKNIQKHYRPFPSFIYAPHGSYSYLIIAISDDQKFIFIACDRVSQ